MPESSGWGRPYTPRSPRSALRRGLAYLPEDRLRQARPADVDRAEHDDGGAARDLPAGILQPRRERRLARSFMERLSIKATSPTQVVRSLSGGNQQKVVLSKWLAWSRAF